jgi:ornithine cyclodeaminase
MASATQWVSEEDVVSALSLGDAVEALTGGFAAEGAGRAAALEKTMLSFDGHSTLHALGAAFSDEQLVGTKTWAHTAGGADPALLLFDTRTGALRAVIEAFALGQLRTAGTAALATNLLAKTDASRMAVIGTGKQSMAQVAAVAHVRSIEEVRAYSRDPTRCAAFARRVAEELRIPCRTSASTEEAVDGAHIVTLVTRATEPVLSVQMLAPGVHINAVGAIDLARREFEPAILAHCASVVTDSLPQVRKLSSEFREFYGTDPAAWEVVRSLGEVVLAEPASREPSHITLFKGMGSGVEDVALGAAILARLDSHDTVEIRRRGRAKVDLVGSSSMNQP